VAPLREWLRPPKSLLLILVLLSLVSVSAVGWFGFKLLEQDRMVQVQRRQERLEQAADRMAATLRGTLAETGERLSAWLATPCGRVDVLSWRCGGRAASGAPSWWKRPSFPPENRRPARRWIAKGAAAIAAVRKVLRTQAALRT
jgi:hypothetical protein